MGPRANDPAGVEPVHMAEPNVTRGLWQEQDGAVDRMAGDGPSR